MKVTTLQGIGQIPRPLVQNLKIVKVTTLQGIWQNTITTSTQNTILLATLMTQKKCESYQITRGDVVANSMDLACRHMQNGFLSYTLNTRDLTSLWHNQAKFFLQQITISVDSAPIEITPSLSDK